MRKRSKPATKRSGDQHAILVRLPVKKHQRLKAVATGESRSVNNAVVVAIDEYVKARSPKSHLTVVPPDSDPEAAA